MKILILNPEFGYDFCKSARWFCRSRGRVQRHPDFLCEATAVLEKAGNKCKFIDGAAKNISFEKTKNIVEKFQPQMVVIQATTPSIYSDLTYASMCKEVMGEECLTVMVGAHVSTETTDTLEKGKGKLDAVAKGEYDYTLRDIAYGKDFAQIQGLSYIKEGNIIHNPGRTFIEDLDEIHFPAWHHIDLYDYHDAGKLYPFITLLGGRGCFGKCTFCLFPQVMYGRKYRFKSPKRVVDEIEWDMNLFPYLKEIMFEDDTLVSNMQKERVEVICNEIINRNLKIAWSANARSDINDIKILKLMKRAGCRMLCVGYEFGNQDMLNNVRKGITIESMEVFSHLCRKIGIRVHGCFMFGGPGETKETAFQTIELAKRLPMDTVQFSGVCAYPGTEFYSWCKENNYLVTKDWSEWVDENLEQRTIVSFPGFSAEEINKMIDKGLRDFYLRPRQMLRMLRNISSWADARTKLYGLKSFLDYFKIYHKKRKRQDLQKEWDNFWRKKAGTRFVKESWSKRRIEAILSQYIKQGDIVLDAGCGSGYFSNYFLRRGCKVLCLDNSQEALNITKQITRGQCNRYLKTNLLNNKYRDELREYFDVIFSDGLLEHFDNKNRQTILRGFAYMKKPQGVVINFVPNKYSWWTLVKPFIMEGIKESPFTLSELMSLHSKDMKIIACGGINVLPFRYSPDNLLGKHIGMLLYTVAK